MFRSALSLLAALGISGALAAEAQTKVYISADMEGVGGAVTGAQLGPGGFEYQRFREFMTDEVLAAIDGARAAGATEFLVSDSHGNGQNLLIDRLPDDVTLVRSWPRPLGMMGGVDESFDAAIFIGFHTSTTNPEGVRAHTFSSATLTDVRLNGTSVAESGFNAALAGHFGVPVVMISGDDAIVEETRRYVGDVEGAVVKWAKSFHSARTLTPACSCEVIREAAERAVSRLGDFPALSHRGARRAGDPVQALPSGRDPRLPRDGRAGGRAHGALPRRGHGRRVQVHAVRQQLRAGALTLSPTAGYSGTPLARKLGIREGHVVALVDAPDELPALLAPLPPGVRLVSSSDTSGADVTLAFLHAPQDAERRAHALAATLAPDASLWLCWPKMTSPLFNGLKGGAIREAGLGAGLVDVKVAAVDEDWSSHKFVFRLENRPGAGRRKK